MFNVHWEKPGNSGRQNTFSFATGLSFGFQKWQYDTLIEKYVLDFQAQEPLFDLELFICYG